MTNPKIGVIAGYASIEDARAAWANLIGNDKLAIYEINIGFAQGKSAQKPVAFVILPDSLNRASLSEG